MNRSIPKQLESYEFKSGFVLVDIFAVEARKTDLILEGMTKEELGHRWTSVARVIASSSENYAVGDIVRLADYKVITTVNVDYEQWNEFPTKGNAKRLGTAPPSVYNNINKLYCYFKFDASPIEIQKPEMYLYLLPEVEVIAKIKNPIHALFS